MKKILLYFFVLIFAGNLSAQVIFEEDFEGGGLGDWTVLDRDGDGNNWEIIDFSTAAIPPPVGGNCISSASWNQTQGPLFPDNVLFSPEIDLTGQSGTVLIDWQALAQDQTWAAEHYKVVLVTEATSDAVDAGEIIYEGEVGSNGRYVTLTGNMSNFVGSKVFVAFVHYMVSDQFRLNIDGVSIYASNSKDVAVTSLVSPDNANGCTLGADESVTVKLTNLGGQAIENFEISYSVNGGAVVTEMVTATIEPAAEYDFTFATPVDLSTFGEYSLEVSTNLDGDTDTSNDTQTFDFVSSDAMFTIHMMTDASSGQQWELEDNETGEVVASNYDGYQWNIEVTENICIFSDKCYTFRYVGEMTDAGTYLELLLNGVRIAGDTQGGAPAELNIPAVGSACPSDDASVVRINNQTFEPVNADVPVSFRVTNVGSNMINSFTASYTVGGGAPVEQTFTQALGLGEVGDFTFDVRHNIAGLTAEMLEVNVTQVNGTDDGEPSNNSASSQLVALSDIPAKSVVIEEGTGTWCGFCPRGAVGVDAVTAAHSDAIGIAVHNSDPMDIGTYDSQLIALVGGTGYPFSGIDRSFEIDPNAASLELAYQFQKLTNAPVGLTVDAVFDGAGNLNVEVSADVKAAILSGDYRFNVVLTEDGLTGTGSDWAQVNFYAGGARGVMGGYELLPDPVPAADMVYNHVARELMGGFEGIAGSFPATAMSGETHSYSFDMVLNPDYDITKMHAVAMLLDGTTGVIVNSVSGSIRDASGTNDVFEHSLAKVYPNPFTSVANIELGIEGTQQVDMYVLNSLGQKVAQKNYGMLSGKTILPFNGSSLESGIYYFHIRVGDKLVTKKLMLNK